MCEPWMNSYLKKKKKLEKFENEYDMILKN